MMTRLLVTLKMNSSVLFHVFFSFQRCFLIPGILGQTFPAAVGQNRTENKFKVPQRGNSGVTAAATYVGHTEGQGMFKIHTLAL